MMHCMKHLNHLQHDCTSQITNDFPKSKSIMLRVLKTPHTDPGCDGKRRETKLAELK